MSSKKTNLPLTQTAANEDFQSNIDQALQDLIVTSESLFKVLDFFSSRIIKLEDALTSIKAHFPFQICVESDQDFGTPTEEHKLLLKHANNLEIEQEWYLAWNIDPQSEKYRLLLIHKKTEYISYEDPESPEEEERIFQEKILLKKPLIETPLETRLIFVEHLEKFIIAFRKHLTKRKNSIESVRDSISSL